MASQQAVPCESIGILAFYIHFVNLKFAEL